MFVLISLPALLSLLVLAAHFLRSGSMWLVGSILLLAIPLFINRPWSTRLVQLVLIAGGLEWFRTLVLLAQRRMDAGAPWLRMAAILGVVICVTVGSAWLLQLRSRLSRTHREKAAFALPTPSQA